jgi:hypothetical protein
MGKMEKGPLYGGHFFIDKKYIIFVYTLSMWEILGDIFKTEDTVLQKLNEFETSKINNLK